MALLKLQPSPLYSETAVKRKGGKNSACKGASGSCPHQHVCFYAFTRTSQTQRQVFKHTHDMQKLSALRGRMVMPSQIRAWLGLASPGGASNGNPPWSISPQVGLITSWLSLDRPWLTKVHNGNQGTGAESVCLPSLPKFILWTPNHPPPSEDGS